jgi:hypothetical protein
VFPDGALPFPSSTERLCDCACCTGRCGRVDSRDCDFVACVVGTDADLCTIRGCCGEEEEEEGLQDGCDLRGRPRGRLVGGMITAAAVVVIAAVVGLVVVTMLLVAAAAAAVVVVCVNGRSRSEFVRVVVVIIAVSLLLLLLVLLLL